MFYPLPTNGNAHSGKAFISLKNDGDSIKGVFRGEPHLFRQHWTNTPQGKRSVDCVGVECAVCKTGDKSKFKFRCNFVTLENGAYVAKIYEGGKTIYDSLADIAKEYGPDKMSGVLLKITRKGQGMDTSYSVVVAPPSAQPNSVELDAIAAVGLNGLE